MRTRWFAGAIGLVTVLLAVGAVVATLVAGWSFDDAVQAFVVSNTLIGVSFGLCGVLIAWHRPGSPLGWMYAAGGLCQTVSGFAAPLQPVLGDAGAPMWLLRLDGAVFQFAWPVNIALVPISLLLLPDGRLASPRWRLVATVIATTSPLFVLEVGLDPAQQPGSPRPYGTLGAPTYESLGWLWTVSEARWVLSVLVGIACLVVRYRSGPEVVRRQLFWLVAAAAVIGIAVTPWALVAGTPLAVLFTIPLLPAAVAAAVLRHQLLDIRLVVARGLTYALLSGLVLAMYAALVVVLTDVASALVVALVALPLRNRLQTAVDRLLYGDRGDPLRVASRVGRSLGVSLEATLEEIRTALRLPYVGVCVEGQDLAVGGRLEGPAASLPLEGGRLVVGLRRGETRLAPADERVLKLLSGPLSTAVHATVLLEQLQRSRERLLSTREHERRRLRRELHDGLGPLLTGVALSADAAANLTGGAPDDAVQQQLSAVRSGARSALSEVRRIVDDLGSPALDEQGLVEALRIRAGQLQHRADGQPLHTVLEAPALPALPPAVEQAVYRIATEALTNVVRHSRGDSVVVRLAHDGADLHCEVLDNGSSKQAWRPGVGIVGMRERVAELGGACDVGPGPGGGHVRVRVPAVPA